MKKLKKKKEGFFTIIKNEIMESVLELIFEVICKVLFFIPRLMFRFIEHIF